MLATISGQTSILPRSRWNRVNKWDDGAAISAKPYPRRLTATGLFFPIYVQGVEVLLHLFRCDLLVSGELSLADTNFAHKLCLVNVESAKFTDAATNRLPGRRPAVVKIEGRCLLL